MDKKVERIIKLYSDFLEGKVVNKKVEAERFEVNQRTIQRDIDDIRMYFANDMKINWQVVYKRNKSGYILLRENDDNLSSQEILTLCKVFMKSGLLIREEMFSIIDKLVQYCVPNEEKKKTVALIATEKIHYEEPEHGRKLLETIKNVSDAIYTHKVLQIEYQLEEKNAVKNIMVQPIAMNYYKEHFYLFAYKTENVMRCKANKVTDNDLPAVYRLDNIKEYKILQEHFHVPYRNQFVEVQFQDLLEKESAI